MIDAYLAAVDEAVPGFVAGLYITGSIALDDYQPATSDIDAVAVCTGRPDAGQCAALAQVHAGGGLRRTELGLVAAGVALGMGVAMVVAVTVTRGRRRS